MNSLSNKIGFTAIFVAFTLMLLNCEDPAGSDNPVPGRVLLVQKSAEEDTVEKGIDAIHIPGSQPARNGITIQWHPVDDDDLVAYVIRRSMINDSTGFATIARVRRSLGKIDTFYVDDDVAIGTRYYYRVTAEDAENEGPPSESDNYLLEPVSNLFSPSNSFDGTFQWEFPSVGGVTPAEFIFHLRYEDRPGHYVYKFIERIDVGNKYGPNQNWSLLELGISPLAPGRYQWRVDIVGTQPNNGSESEWLNFQVQ